MLERYSVVGGHLRLSQDGTVTSYEDAQAIIADLQGQLKAHKLVIDDHHRLVRELDVAMNGTEGAAKQASLCDLVSQISVLQQRVAQLEGEIEAMEHSRDEWRASFFQMEKQRDTIQADHARVLGVAEMYRKALSLISVKTTPWFEGHHGTVEDILAAYASYVLKEAASLPAQPAQGGV